jgi:hypothetical protein
MPAARMLRPGSAAVGAIVRHRGAFIRNRQTEREYATAEQTDASYVSAARSMMMRHCGITDSSEAISHPASFAESSISTLSHFLNLSVARHAFLNCARSFF